MSRFHPTERRALAGDPGLSPIEVGLEDAG